MNIRSLRTRILVSFLLVVIVPTILISVISLGSTVKIVEQNVKELTDSNLKQINKNLNLTLSEYEDILMQLYTDDNIIEQVDNINIDENVALSSSQLLRRLREIANTKLYIESIMIIPANGEPLFFDKLTAAATKSSWMKSYGYKVEDIYGETIMSPQTVIYPTQYAATITGEDYYLFHMAHRLIDYRNIQKEVGIIIFSINRDLLGGVCNEENEDAGASGINFITNDENIVMCFPEKKYIGEKLPENASGDGKVKSAEYEALVEKAGLFDGSTVLVNYTADEESGWTIVNVAPRDILLRDIKVQQTVVGVIIFSAVIVLGLLSIYLSSYLMSSIKKIMLVMSTVSAGNISARVTIDRNMPEEIETIASKFNYTMERLEDSMEKERVASAKQRDAEIKFLEAQINPHFLYNTLDTINWMAVEEDQYNISNAISTLAYILRYGIEDNNQLVPLRREVDWLKKYIFLQQTRLKTEIECRIHVEPGLINCQIHKLLLQPFVENAIMHGFEKGDKQFILELNIRELNGKMEITIEDNGKGMEQEVLENLESEKEEEKQHIGVRNAVKRVKMYYGESADVRIRSAPGQGTVVTLEIPKTEGERSEDENCDS